MSDPTATRTTRPTGDEASAAPAPATVEARVTSSPRGSPPADRAPQPEQLEPDTAGGIEIDHDADSAYAASTTGTDTDSLRSSLLDYKWEHGRRYHAGDDSKYWGANDERQQDAEDMAHQLHLLLLQGKLTDAPISENIQNVLDIGCGTGAWAIDFADVYPSAEVIGVDLSPIQPSYVPPNCKFEIDNINLEWTYPENHFDFIHIRGMIGCVPDWVEFHKKVLKHLKPGGWVEQVQLSATVQSDDGSLKPDAAMVRWQKVVDQVGEKMGNNTRTCEIQRDAIEQAGFGSVTETRTKIPIGPWAKDKKLKTWGLWNRAYLLSGLEGFVLRGLTTMLGWTYEECQLYLVQVRKELNDPSIHSYLELSVVTAQKPLRG